MSKRKKNKLSTLNRKVNELQAAQADSQELAMSHEQQLVRVSTTQRTITAHSGPLPSPEDLGHYEEIEKGLGVRTIVGMATKEQDARHEDRRAARSIQKLTILATIGAALVMGLAVVGVALYLAYRGHAPEAAVVMGVLAAVVGAFLIKRHSSAKDEAEAEAEGAE